MHKYYEVGVFTAEEESKWKKLLQEIEVKYDGIPQIEPQWIVDRIVPVTVRCKSSPVNISERVTAKARSTQEYRKVWLYSL